MCGIAGIYAFSKEGKQALGSIDSAAKTLRNRGPDALGIYKSDKAAMGHARLSVIDLSAGADQPLKDMTGRYTIVANAEIYNYKSLREDLVKKGVPFKTSSDTEVLLYMYIFEGPGCLEKLNGFFSFAVYDNQEDILFIARDRFGIKPLIFFRDQQELFFASEMKALVDLGIPKIIDRTSLSQYFQFNYIPSPYTIFENVEKLLPGHYLTVKDNQVKIQQYYTIPFHREHMQSDDYPGACKTLRSLIAKSVRLRMVSDVPLGAFLSGGVDSSIIVAEAAEYKNRLNTFSIGYTDEPYFDETDYAELVAKKFNTIHHTFKLTNKDIYHNLHGVLDDIDEPFADSSALPVHILSRLTRNHVTVALSGDGADEIFAGYIKHKAHFHAAHQGILSSLIKLGQPIWQGLPKSRNSKLTNLWRQLDRYGKALNLSPKERYWYWASVLSEEKAGVLVQMPTVSSTFRERKEKMLKHIMHPDTLNDILYTDMQLVLVSDILHKVDAMSMANSLEVRTPFLDHNLVNFAFSLDDTFKIRRNFGKRVLQDAYQDRLPPALYRRPKQGFEVPLLKWFRTELRDQIETHYLHPDLIESQQIFDPAEVSQMKTRLFSSDPGDVPAQIWAMIVFQHWWKKYME